MTSTNSSTARRQPTAVSRMKQDYMRLKRDPLPYITAEPLPSNILEWHYVVKGPEDSPYFGGYYHGTLLFPREFPFKPPSIYMLTPNGRFKTNTRLCLSISDFHPDTWNPTWCVGTILTGLLSFMLESTPTLGSIETTSNEKKSLARKSMEFNLKNHHFRELFPDICQEINERIQKEQRPTTNGVIPNGSIANGSSTQLSSTCNGGVANANILDPVLAQQEAVAVINRANPLLNWNSVYSNLVVGISFAIFVLIVNYVIKNINTE